MIRSSGSIPVPSDFDIRRPSGAWMIEVMWTSEKGTRPVNSSPIMIIRATHRKMMSRPVTSASVGYKARSCGVSTGHPSVANGHRALENQVSSTSGSRSHPSPSGAVTPT